MAIWTKQSAGIPTLNPDEQRALRAAEDVLDAELKANGGQTDHTYSTVKEQVAGLTPMTWRALLLMYENAGYEVAKIVPRNDDDSIWRFRYTPRAQKR